MNAMTLLDLDTLEEFFLRVQALKEDTREAREQILADLIKEKKAVYLGTTEWGPATLARKMGALYVSKLPKPSIKKEGE